MIDFPRVNLVVTDLLRVDLVAINLIIDLVSTPPFYSTSTMNHPNLTKLQLIQPPQLLIFIDILLCVKWKIICFVYR